MRIVSVEAVAEEWLVPRLASFKASHPGIAIELETKRDVDREALRESWEKQAAGLGFDARGLAAEAIARAAGRVAGREPVREPAVGRDAAGESLGRGDAAAREAEPGSGLAEPGAAVREPVANGPAAEAVDWWASTVHAFQGRTVDTMIAAMEANHHPHLTTQKTLYVEISRARD